MPYWWAQRECRGWLHFRGPSQRLYTEILRGTSALIQLFYLFFILPVLGIDTTPMVAAALGLGLTFSAYGAEIVRAGILGVDPGQWDAARALGMPRSLAFRRIIAPQAFATMLAPFGNLLVELLKSTSLVSLITLTRPDLLRSPSDHIHRQAGTDVGHGTSALFPDVLSSGASRAYP